MNIEIDLYEVMARMLIGFGDSRLPMPAGETAADLAARLRQRLALLDKDYHDDLINAAKEVTNYVVDRIMEAHFAEVAGHA
jgi:hypothetical protein